MTLAPIEDREGGVGEDLGAEHDIRLAGVLGPMVADAVDAGDEHHPGAQLVRDDLRVVAGAARHAQMRRRRVPLGGGLDRLLEHAVHRPRLDLRHRRDLGAARPGLIALGDHLVKRRLERGEVGRIDVAELHLHVGAARHDAGRVGVEQDAPDRPHRARAGERGKAVVDARRQPHHRDPGILAPRHLGRAGMVLLTRQRDHEIADADDRLDDPDAAAGRFERVALLDMRFEVADITRGIDLLTLPAGEPGLFQRLGERHAVAALAGGELVLADRRGERAAAEHLAVMPLLVGPGDRIDAEPVAIRIGGEGARQLDRVDDAERAVEPAAIGLRLAVRADQQTAAGGMVAAKDIADAVDLGNEAGGGELLGEPMARGDVVGRIGRAMHAGLVASELGQPLQIRHHPLAIDPRHVLRPSRQPVSELTRAPGEPGAARCVS